MKKDDFYDFEWHDWKRLKRIASQVKPDGAPRIVTGVPRWVDRDPG